MSKKISKPLLYTMPTRRIKPYSSAVLAIASVLLLLISSPINSSAQTPAYILDQSNEVTGNCTNIIPANNVTQTFTPSLNSLVRVGINICTLNTDSASETITADIYGPSGGPLRSASQTVTQPYDGVIYFDFATLLTTPGVQLKLVVSAGTGRSIFGWKYTSVDTYAGGEAIHHGDVIGDFFFLTYAGDNLGYGSRCNLDAECASNNCVNAVTAAWYDNNGACCLSGEYWVVNHCEACTDADGDEVCEDPSISDAADNCPTVPNPDQVDSNMNGIGDVCESTLPPPEPFQPVPDNTLFENVPTPFVLLFDANGNSEGVECLGPCTIKTLELTDPELKVEGLTLRYVSYDAPFTIEQSPICTYVRTRSGGVKKICECQPGDPSPPCPPTP